jgi:hypothetical protein
VIPEEQEFADTFSRALAEDIRAHPVGGPLVRVVVRWEEETQPLYFTAHALGADELDEVAPEDAWYPLEWPNLDHEMERADRLAEDPILQRAGDALKAQYADRGEEDHEEGEAAGEWGHHASPAIVEAVRMLPDALREAGVSLDEEFVASASHFEGWGALKVLEETADPEVLAALEGRDELPYE